MRILTYQELLSLPDPYLYIRDVIFAISINSKTKAHDFTDLCKLFEVVNTYIGRHDKMLEEFRDIAVTHFNLTNDYQGTWDLISELCDERVKPLYDKFNKRDTQS